MIGHDPTRIYKAAVIGAGSGGLTLAIGLAGFGHDVVLIEGRQIGGDCTNVGCIPSKTLLNAARSDIANPLAWTRAKRDDLARRETIEITEHDRVHLVSGCDDLLPAGVLVAIIELVEPEHVLAQQIAALRTARQRLR